MIKCLKLKGIVVLLAGACALFLNMSYAEILTPAAVLKRVLSKNSELAAMESKFLSQDYAIRSSYSLQDPKIGIMQEKNMTRMEQEMGAMKTWSVSQEILFPTKYFAKGATQRASASVARQEFLNKKLDLRQKALTSYFNFYAGEKILKLRMAQKDTLRQIARVAEAKRGAGTASQQDEMKSHVEQTRVENELLLQKLELIELQSDLNAILNFPPNKEMTLPETELKKPILQSPLKDVSKLTKNSKIIETQEAVLKKASAEKTLAWMSYLPDLMLTYQEPYGSNKPENAYSLGVEMSIPLWFFTKQTSEVASSKAAVWEARNTLIQTKIDVDAKAQTMASAVETYDKLLSIFETALIPQAESTLKASHSAYSAGKVGFVELLDSQNTLYSIKMDYYRNIAKYVDVLLSLERLVAQSLSDLPFEGGGL
ncbi:MAG: TolC family protein [Deltaproteobacteria bacterium]|nr:TolC family protein [Deltaproteobacteria bacterium]